MAKLNWLNKAIKTQYRRKQNDYAGSMGVRFRKKEQLEEQERIRQEALADQEKIERRIQLDLILPTRQT